VDEIATGNGLAVRRAGEQSRIMLDDGSVPLLPRSLPQVDNECISSLLFSSLELFADDDEPLHGFKLFSTSLFEVMKCICQPSAVIHGLAEIKVCLLPANARELKSLMN
jgi:hypothetical protein